METTTTSPSIPALALRWAGRDHFAILRTLADGGALLDLIGDEPGQITDEHTMGHRLSQLTAWGCITRTPRCITPVGWALLGRLIAAGHRLD